MKLSGWQLIDKLGFCCATAKHIGYCTMGVVLLSTTGNCWNSTGNTKSWFLPHCTGSSEAKGPEYFSKPPFIACPPLRAQAQHTARPIATWSCPHQLCEVSKSFTNSEAVKAITAPVQSLCLGSTLVSSPPCLPLWVPWAAWVYTCLPLVSHSGCLGIPQSSEPTSLLDGNRTTSQQRPDWWSTDSPVLKPCVIMGDSSKGQWDSSVRVAEIVPLLSSRGYCTVCSTHRHWKRAAWQWEPTRLCWVASTCTKKCLLAWTLKQLEADTVNCSLAKGHSDLCFDTHGTSDVSFGGFMYIIWIDMSCLRNISCHELPKVVLFVVKVSWEIISWFCWGGSSGGTAAPSPFACSDGRWPTWAAGFSSNELAAGCWLRSLMQLRAISSSTGTPLNMPNRGRPKIGYRYGSQITCLPQVRSNSPPWRR